jgi:hypothetical protein
LAVFENIIVRENRPILDLFRMFVNTKTYRFTLTHVSTLIFMLREFLQDFFLRFVDCSLGERIPGQTTLSHGLFYNTYTHQFIPLMNLYGLWRLTLPPKEITKRYIKERMCEATANLFIHKLDSLQGLDLSKLIYSILPGQALLLKAVATDRIDEILLQQESNQMLFLSDWCNNPINYVIFPELHHLTYTPQQLLFFVQSKHRRQSRRDILLKRINAIITDIIRKNEPIVLS